MQSAGRKLLRACTSTVGLNPRVKTIYLAVEGGYLPRIPLYPAPAPLVASDLDKNSTQQPVTMFYNDLRGTIESASKEHAIRKKLECF